MSVRAAGYVIYRRILQTQTIEYLLLQASYGVFHWSTPKGHVDPGECEKTTALRELQEETGLGSTDIKIIPEFEKTLNYTVNGKPKSVVYYLAELINLDKEVKISHEHKDFKWLPLEEACALAKFAESQDLLKASDQFIRSSS